MAHKARYITSYTFLTMWRGGLTAYGHVRAQRNGRSGIREADAVR